MEDAVGEATNGRKALARVGFRLSFGFDGTDAGRRVLAERLPMVALRPRVDEEAGRTTGD